MMKRIVDFWNQKNIFQKENQDNARRGRLLNILLVGIFILGSIALITSIILITIDRDWSDPGNGLIIITIVLLISSSWALFFINQKSVSIASVLFLIVFTIILTFSDFPAEIVRGRSSFVYFILVTISSLLLRPISSFIFAGISSVLLIVLSRVGETNMNILIIAGLFFLAIISWLSASSLENALRDLRTINTNLDNIVIERTNELADALTRERIEAGRNQAILNSIADGVIVFNKQNVATLANPALSRLTEIPAQSLNRISLNQFIDSQTVPIESQELIKILVTNPNQSQIGTRISWGEKILSTSVAQVQDPKTNESIGSVAVFRDITQETQLEKMKDNFVAVISHELRTPLNAIMGHVEILKEAVYGPLNERQMTVTERVMINISRLLNMVGDLLDEAHIRAGKLSIKPGIIKTTSLIEVLRASIEKSITDKGLSFITEVKTPMPETIIGDPQRLQQILINLTNNSLKFTETGFIKVIIDRVGLNQWKIETSDSGVGIPENEIPFIFDTFRQANNFEFTTRQHGGIGLGLSIVKQLVELMNGEIKVTSQLGKGTTFTILLPLITK